jgi:predicted nucleic acid-binding protein
VRFWDSSAVVPLLVQEQESESMQALLDEDPVQLVWWGTTVECASALSRAGRSGGLGADEARRAFEDLGRLQQGWHEVQPVEPVRSLAARLLRVHPLRAADALQLAAALVAAEGRPETLEVVTLDGRLSDAARVEGLVVRGTD